MERVIERNCGINPSSTFYEANTDINMKNGRKGVKSVKGIDDKGWIHKSSDTF